MKSFDQFQNEINETTRTSNHRRTATQMALVHKSNLIFNGHAILNHETTGTGSHIIHHLTPNKKVRVTTIKPVYSGQNNSEVEDRPGTPEEQTKYGPKK